MIVHLQKKRGERKWDMEWEMGKLVKPSSQTQLSWPSTTFSLSLNKLKLGSGLGPLGLETDLG